MPARRVPQASPWIEASWRRIFSISRAAAALWSSTCSPAGVKRMPCRERSTISTPSSCSSALIRLDSADWVIYSLSAAWVMLRVSSSACSSS